MRTSIWLKLFCCASLLLALSCNVESVDRGDTDNEDSSDMADDGSEDATLQLIRVFENVDLNQPVDLQAPNDGLDRIFVVEKQGRIKVFENNPEVGNATVFLDLSNRVNTSSEQGLLGLAFHPNYRSNGFFYVYYNPDASRSFISRFTVSTDANVANADSEAVLLEIPQPRTNHNGGQLAFGPDGYLYIASGDGGGSGDPDNNAQNRENLLGKILRIDVDADADNLAYGIPSDNPFVEEEGIRSEIFAYGLRNPWRMSFDSQDGRLFAADVGQNAVEEVNVITSGGNYGWNIFEGNACFSNACNNEGLVMPIFEYTHDNGDRSITGGYVYRGNEVSLLAGKYVFGDYVSGRIWTIDTNGENVEEIESTGYRISSFGVDSNQELFVMDFLEGAVYKFTQN